MQFVTTVYTVCDIQELFIWTNEPYCQQNITKYRWIERMIYHFSTFWFQVLLKSLKKKHFFEFRSTLSKYVVFCTNWVNLESIIIKTYNPSIIFSTELTHLGSYHRPPYDTSKGEHLKLMLFSTTPEETFGEFLSEFGLVLSSHHYTTTQSKFF